MQDQLVGVQHVYSTGDAFVAVRGDGSVVTWGALPRAHTEPPSLRWRAPPAVELAMPAVWLAAERGGGGKPQSEVRRGVRAHPRKGTLTPHKQDVTVMAGEPLWTDQHH